jgi:predicted dehydrogenase
VKDVSSPPYSVLICGAGNIAHRFDTPQGDDIFTHVKGFTRHGGFRLQAIVDEQTERAEEAARVWNIFRFGRRLEDVSAERFDVVSICTPDHTHAAYLREVLTLRPKLVFCEKPLSASKEEAAQIVAEYAAQGVLLAVNYSRRWLAEFQDIAARARAEEFGAVVSARVKYYKGFLHNASHLIDLLSMMTTPAVLHGAILKSVVDYANDDPTISCAALLHSPIAGGNEFSLMVEGYDARHMSPIELEIIFERALVQFEELSGSYLTLAALRENATYPGFFEFSDRRRVLLDPSAAMRSAVASLYDALRNDAPLACTGTDALETLRLCKQIQSFSYLL